MDLEVAVWTIPAKRTKVGKEHRVPLSLAAIEILKQAAELHAASQLVFPGRSRGRPLSREAFRALLPSATLHGFRSSFRDWAAEKTNFSRELCEQALAHAIGNEAELAYRRTDLLERRRALMEQWADFISSPFKPSTSISGPA
jgi:integrase